MSNKLIIKHRAGSTGEPDGSTIGELAANILDKKFFIATGAGNLVFATQDYLDDLIGKETGTGIPTMTNNVIDADQLPATATVDDVVEYVNQAAFPGTGISGVLYIAADTNKIYRWSGAAYDQLGSNGITNLSHNTAVDSVEITSDTGNNTIIAEASGTIAGVMSVAMYNKLTGIVFGTSDTNTVVVDSASIASGQFAKWTASGLEGRTSGQMKTDLLLDSVENTALSTWLGTTALTTLGTITTGVWNGTAIDDAYISSAATWNAKQDPATTIAGYGITDAYTKTEIESLLQGLNAKESVTVASTANIDLTTGTLLTIDGVLLADGDRVLVKDQTLPAENGIYIAGTGAWSRAADTNTAAEMTSAYAFVEEGTANQDTAWLCSTDDIVLDATGLTFVKFAGSGAYQAADADLSAIAALTGSTGFLRKTGENTWSIDTTTYEPTDVNISRYNDATANFTGNLQENGVDVLTVNSTINGGTF